MWGVAVFIVLVVGSIGLATGMHYQLVVRGKHGRYEIRRTA